MQTTIAKQDILIYQTKNDASAAVRAEATKILEIKKIHYYSIIL